MRNDKLRRAMADANAPDKSPDLSPRGTISGMKGLGRAAGLPARVSGREGGYGGIR